MKWTKEEDNLLKKNYPNLTMDELLEIFKGRSPDSIEHRARRLRLKKSQFFYNKGQGEKMKAKVSGLSREEIRELRELWRKKTFYEAVRESIEGVIPRIEAPKVQVEPLRPKKIKNREELGLLFSDTHIGLVVDQKETGGLGKYNYKIFKEEIHYEEKSIKRILEIEMQGTEYKVLNIFFLGDIVENRIMRESQIRLTDLPIVEQIFLAVDEIAKFIADLSPYFKKINAYCITGQHGRMTQKKSVLSPQDNFDFLVYHWIAERLGNYKNVKFYIPNSWWMVVERNKTKFYMEHGDQFRAWMSIPFYGLQRGRARLRELLRQYVDQKKQQVDFDYFVVGHFHEFAYFEDVLMNGSFPGLTEYSGKDLKLGEKPRQMLFSIHPARGVTWFRPIQLKERMERAQIRVYR